MAVTTLTAVRHAKVALAGICYGRATVPLTITPQEAADQMMSRAGLQFDGVWSSPAPRCAQPAALWAQACTVEHRIDERLYELAYGEWELLSWDDVPRSELDHWGGDWIHRAPPGGESARDLEERVRHWVEELPAGNWGLSAHAGVIRGLHVVIGGMSWQDAMQCAAPHLEPVCFRW